MFLSIIPSWWHEITSRAEYDSDLVRATQDSRIDRNKKLWWGERYIGHYHQLPWLESCKELGSINIILPHSLFPSKSCVSKIFTFWLRFDSRSPSNPLGSFLGSEDDIWGPLGRSDVDSCSTDTHGTFWSWVLPSHPCLHTEKILCQWHVPLTAEVRDTLGTRVGERGFPFLEKKNNPHMHINTPRASVYVTRLIYAPTNEQNWPPERLHILTILKTLPFLVNWTRPCPVPSAPLISYHPLSGLNLSSQRALTWCPGWMPTPRLG